MFLRILSLVVVSKLIVVNCIECGRVFTQSHGSIHSPVHSALSDTKIGEVVRCDYVIQAPSGHRVKVVFVDLIVKTTCCSCINDYIELRDGNNENSTLIGRFCGQNLPKIVYSTGKSLWLRFRTDYKTSSENRFKLTFDTPCGHHFSALEGVFTSAGFPGPYTPHTECIYTISVPRGRLKVSFESFDIEARSAVCEFDFLEVKEILYVEYNTEILGSRTRRYCGSETPPTIYSTVGSYLWFRFKTDSNGQRSGFKAIYRTVSVGEGTCNKKFNSQKGLIYSKNYPFQFPRKTKCEWKIEVESGKFVHLTFDTFNFSLNAPKCKYGYLRVYDGLGFQSQVGEFCGSHLPRDIISRQNAMSLELVSSSAVNTGWFSAQYSMSNNGPCGTLKFTCSNHECIIKSKHCDGIKDCRDGSDESGCPPVEDEPTWYSFWPVTVVVVMLFMGIWLWRTWRKFMRPRRDIQVTYCASPCRRQASNSVISEVLEPPSYHEAISQPAVHNIPPPTYEEAMNSQPATHIDEVTNLNTTQDTNRSNHDLTEHERTGSHLNISSIHLQSPPSTQVNTDVNESGQPYTSHRPLDRASQV